MKRWGRIIVFLLVVITGISQTIEAQEQSRDDELLFGMSTALSGPAGDLGRNMLSGIMAEFNEVNSKGGVNGRLIRLIVLDDGYEPIRTAPNMRKLIEKENVLAVIGNVGTPTAIAAIPIANEKKTLLYAPFTGAGVLRKSPPDRYVINYRASYAQETGAMIDALINILDYKIEEIAFMTQRDGYGDAGYNGGITALKKYGLKDESEVFHVRYERNTLAVEDAVAELMLADIEPKAIIMVGAYAPCAKFIKLAEENGINALFLNVSFVGSKSLARELGKAANGRVIVTQVVPHYQGNTKIAKTYREDMRVYEEETPSFIGLEGYIGAKILLKALKSIEGKPNRKNIIDALESLGNFNIGMEEMLTLSTNDHQASDKVWSTILKDGNFISFDWKDLKGF